MPQVFMLIKTISREVSVPQISTRTSVSHNQWLGDGNTDCFKIRPNNRQTQFHVANSMNECLHCKTARSLHDTKYNEHTTCNWLAYTLLLTISSTLVTICSYHPLCHSDLCTYCETHFTVSSHLSYPHSALNGWLSQTRRGVPCETITDESEALRG